MGISGRSELDASVASSPTTRSKFGSWTMVTPAVEMSDGLYLLKDGDGALNYEYEPLQKVTGRKPKGILEYRNMAGYDTPEGTAGLLVQTSNQDEFQYLFFPIGPGPLLVDSETGKKSTRAFPVEGGAINYNKPAGIHSLLRIEQLPGGAYIPALNLSESPDKGGYGAFVSKGAPQQVITKSANIATTDTTGTTTKTAQATVAPKKSPGGGHWEWVNIATPGSVIQAAVRKWIPDPPKTVTQSEVGRPVVGFLSWEVGGPIHPGSAGGDQHELGQANKTACNSGHLDINALFFANSQQDGPLDFSEDVPFPVVKNITDGQAVPVHLSWDEGVGHMWRGNVSRVGKWRWWAVLPNAPVPPTTTTPPTTGVPPVTTTVPPGQTTKPPRITTTTGLEGKTKNYFDQIEAGVEVWDQNFEDNLYDPNGTTSSGDKHGINTIEMGVELFGEDYFFKGAPPQITTAKLDPGKSHSVPQILQPAIQHNETSFPAIALHAVRPPTMPYVPRFGEGLSKRKQTYKTTGGAPPLTAKIQGFGKSENKKWVYAQQPGRYYQSGTAKGGLYVTPPEHLLDGENTASMSETTLTLHPEVFLAWGDPQIDGTVINGPKLAIVGATGSRDLAMSFSDNAGAARDGMLKLDGLFHAKERSGTPTCSDGYATLYIDTADGHAKIAWQDGVTARSIDLGAVT